MLRKIPLPIILLGPIITVHAAGFGASDIHYKATTSETPKANDAERRVVWPAYDVQLIGLTDELQPEVKSALLRMGNIDEVSFKTGGVVHITVKDETKPVWFSNLKATLTKVPGIDVKGYRGLEKKADTTAKDSSVSPANRQTWPLYRAQFDGLTDDRKDALKAALLKMQNVDSVSVKADGVVYVIAKKDNYPIWYLQLKAAIAEVPGVVLKSWKGIDENEGSGSKPAEPAKPKAKETEKPKAVARSSWPYYRFQITGFDASRWHALKAALLDIKNVGEVSGKKGGVVYITVKDERKALLQSAVNPVVGKFSGFGVKDFKGCTEKE